MVKPFSSPASLGLLLWLVVYLPFSITLSLPPVIRCAVWTLSLVHFFHSALYMTLG